MEQRPRGQYLALLMLEWMRIINQANAWSQGTHRNYQSFLRKLRRFDTSYGVVLLQLTPLPHPPRHPSIGVMWAQQQSTLQAPSSTHTQSGESIQFGTARGLRSAASQFYLWDHQRAHPEQTLRDSATRKVYLVDGVSPTDAIGYGLMAVGMGKRMGDESKRPIALTLQKVLWISAYLETQWKARRGVPERRKIAAAMTDLIGWLGWLQSQELFSLTWGDVTVTQPKDGPRLGLLAGVGGH
jgi:hypothetical protein